MNLLLDLFAAAVLLIGIFNGMKKGFAKTFFSLLGSIGGFIVAILCSKQLSTVINEKFVSPLLQEKTTKYLESLLGAKTAANGTEYFPIEEYLNNIPDIFKTYIEKMGGTVDQVKQAFSTSSSSIENAREAAINSIYSTFASTISTCIAFLAIFFGVMVLCAILGAVFSTIFKLPVLNSINKIGGGITGLVKSAVILIVIASAFSLLAPIYKNDDLPFLGKTDINETQIMKHFAIFSNLGNTDD